MESDYIYMFSQKRVTIYEAINVVIYPISQHVKVIFLFVEKSMLK